MFGGSWGSTLSLAYAQAYPERATELVLRGIFLFRQNELDWLYRYGASEMFPEGWDDFLAPVPADERGDMVAAYRRRLTGDDAAVAARAPPRRGATGKALTVTLLPDPDMHRRIHRATSSRSPSPASKTTTWSTRAGSRKASCWRGAEKLRGIPGVIVQGRHDCCTPPRAAWELKQAWPEVELKIVPDGGHLYSEPGILDGLVRATDKFAGL